MSEEDDVDIVQLLVDAGPRLRPPADRMDLAREASRNVWRQVLAQRRGRRWRQSLAMAAALVLAVSTGFYLQGSRPTDFQVEVAEATSLIMGEQLRPAGSYSVEPGMHMTTNTPARLIAANNVDLRLMADTHIRWLDAQHVHLVSGSLYVDTHGAGAFDVDTDHGSVRDVGTRYQVQVDADATEVIVRDGEVEVEAQARRVLARGDGVTAQVVGVNSMGVTVNDEPASSPRWAWTLEVAPDYPVAGVRTLLDRISADLGKRLVFESPGVEAALANLKLSTGSLSGTDPTLALEALVRSSGLNFTQNPQEIRLRF